MDTADKLKKLRIEKHMTQQQLASALGVSQSVLSRWESGDTAPSLKFRRVIAAYCGMTIDEFFG